jgi:hypothetical protein
MLIGIVAGLGIATWVAAHVAFCVDGYVVGFHIHLEQ